MSREGVHGVHEPRDFPEGFWTAQHLGDAFQLRPVARTDVVEARR